MTNFWKNSVKAIRLHKGANLALLVRLAHLVQLNPTQQPELKVLLLPMSSAISPQ